MTVDWLSVRAAPLEAVEHGVAANDDVFETTYTGPKTWDRMDYPVAEVMPQDTTRSAGNEFSHTLMTNLYFERGRETDYIDDVLHPVAGVIDDTLSALSDTECVLTYVPTSIEDFAGEVGDSLVILVSITWEVTTLVDLAET